MSSLETLEKQGYRFELCKKKSGKIRFTVNKPVTGSYYSLMMIDADNIVSELISRLPPNPYSNALKFELLEYKHNGTSTDVVIKEIL